MAISGFTFGILIGNVLDARALINGLVALGLAAFSMRAALSATTAQA
jgi:hypothetical protein